MTQKTIAFIGLGAMGKPMAINVAKAGFALQVFDVQADAVAALVATGAVAAASPAKAAAGCDVVLMSLPNAAIVASVVAGEDGVLAGSHAGQIIVDLSSVSPEQSRRMARLAEARGVSYLDAPVSGGVAGAIAGTLTIMVGGSADAVAACEPILKLIGKTIHHVGAVGTGDAMKLVNNLLLGINMAGVAEALTLGVKAGLDPKVMLDVIRGSSGRSYALEAKGENFILKGKFESGFAIDLQYKDLEIATQTGKDLGVPLVMTNLAQQVFETARAEGLGRNDISAIITMLERLAKVQVRS